MGSWNTGEPNNHPHYTKAGEDCVMLLANYKMTDLPCFIDNYAGKEITLVISYSISLLFSAFMCLIFRLHDDFKIDFHL